MMRYLKWNLGAGALLAMHASLAACGGETSLAGTGGGDGGFDAQGPRDGGRTAFDAPAPWSAVCPLDEPAMAGACTTQGLECEYGCNDVLVCDESTWNVAVSFGMPIVCDAGPNPTACPATLEEVTAGTSCGSAPSCTYASGRCDCEFPQDPEPDAGATWSCFPPSGCPWPRARVGSPCTSPGLQCVYETCGDTQVCMGNVWQLSSGGGCGG